MKEKYTCSHFSPLRSHHLTKRNSCQTNPNDEYEAAEWYGLNTYVFCNGKAKSYDDALGFQLLGESFKSYDYSIPVLLTEFGCLSETFPTEKGYAGQRNFLQAKWLLEEPFMREVFSGGFAFEYSIEMAYAKSDSPYPFHHAGKQNYGIGHMQNETCDDITNPCSYVPHPSFYNLKEAYDTAVITSQATKDTFVPSKNRISNTKCPAHYPALNEFEWLTDRTPNIVCPRKGMDSQFVCPADYKQLLVQHSNSRMPPDFYTVILPIILIVVAAIAIFIVRKYQPDFSGTKSPRKNSLDASLSEESDGLLSMKSYNRQTGGEYQALSSDSSSEDLAAKDEP